MKKIILSVAILALGFTSVYAQEEDQQEEPKKGFDKSKLFFGGNFGLTFGSNTFVNISPQVGYRFNQYLAAGAGPSFIYYSYRTMDGRFSQGYAGANIFGRFYPIPYIFGQVQPELNYMWGSFKYGSTREKLPGQTVPSLLLGAGGAIPMGTTNGALLLMIQYDAIQASGNPYGRRAFFTVGYNF
ncbi:MAG: hypothetical protein KIT80_08710 [Chitinophagaceae bacterium]|nr:hypothetical protein [Chitinophagaceae bacterium]MCW5926977.1 hypothetical protein [Chitinophagaceae bacterium]